MSVPRFLMLLFVAITSASCSSDDDNALRELNANRQLWASSDVKNYSWNERLSCFCAGVLVRDIFVIDGVKDHIEFDETTLPPGVTYQDIFDSTRSVEEAFDFIESILDQDVASLFIEYDATYGFPKNIGIDYIKDAVDDEIGYIYTDFEITN